MNNLNQLDYLLLYHISKLEFNNDSFTTYRHLYNVLKEFDNSITETNIYEMIENLQFLDLINIDNNKLELTYIAKLMVKDIFE